jgi:5-methylcytosine-specific restriction endonuclease McrA
MPDGYAEAIARATGFCERCRIAVSTRRPPWHPQRLEVNHKVPRSQGGTNDAENLEVLCRDCHQGHGHAPTAERGARLRHLKRDAFFR